MRWNGALRQIRRIRGFRLFLNLDEQRVVNRAPEQEHDIVAQAHTAGPYHAEGDILDLILGEEVRAFGQQRFGICA
jgi:hypothetical protein